MGRAESEVRHLQSALDRVFKAAIEGDPELRWMGYNDLLDTVCERLASGALPLLSEDPSPPELADGRWWEIVGGPRRSLIEGE